MTENDKKSEKKKLADARAKRRSQELRANLMRRKAQLRSRRAGEEDSRSEGIAAAASPDAVDKPEEN